MEMTIKLNDNGQFEVSGNITPDVALKVITKLKKEMCKAFGIPPMDTYGDDLQLLIDKKFLAPIEHWGSTPAPEYPAFVLHSNVVSNSLDLKTWCSNPKDMVLGLLALCRWNFKVTQELVGFHDTIVLHAFISSICTKDNISIDELPLGTGDILRRFIKDNVPTPNNLGGMKK